MSKHTPGPWVWSGLPGSSELKSAHGNVFSYDAYENMWPGRYDGEDGEDAANMRLIAAAPDLLEACMRLCFGPAHPDWAAHYAQAQAAIAKAEGK